MAASFCGKCLKLIDDFTCPHCDIQTKPMNLAPPWIEDYERDEIEDDYRDEQAIRPRLDTFCACPRHP